MPWYPGAIRTTTPNAGEGTLDPVAVVCHRTDGYPAGDLAVLNGSRAPIGFHLLVLPDGKVWQGASTTARCNHAAGGNSWSVGVEVSSYKNAPMTDAQIQSVGRLCGWISRTHNIPLTYDPGPVRKGKRPGFLAHNAVLGSDHTDKWTPDEWSRIYAFAQSPPARQVVVPNVVGFDVVRAADTVRRAGLKCFQVRTRRGLVADRVCEQKPSAGALAAVDSSVTVTVDEGPSMNVVTYADQLHVFDVSGGDLWHRWYDTKFGRWLSESVAGPKATAGAAYRQPVRDGQATAVVEYGQLHVFSGQVHAWYSAGVWASELLP